LFAFEQPATSLEDAASKSRTTYYWYIYGLNDYTGFDFDYVPVPWQSQFIHVWPNQYQPNGEVYLAQKTNSGEFHFHSEQGVHRLPDPTYWNIPNTVDPASIDWRWCPDPADPPYNYVFGNQWHPGTIDPTATYCIPGATESKFVHDFVVTVKPNMERWEILDDITGFDYSWKPDPTEPPYIYVFGNQWLTPEQRPALQYRVAGATQYKYLDEPKATRMDHPGKFKTHYLCEFDYSWEPDPGSPPYNYVFGNQWYPGEVMPTVEYPMIGATETKFMDIPARLLEKHDNHWHTLVDCEFDYSWLPDPGDTPYIYVFGNQWYPAEVMPTVEYTVPGQLNASTWM